MDDTQVRSESDGDVKRGRVCHQALEEPYTSPNKQKVT